MTGRLHASPDQELRKSGLETHDQNFDLHDEVMRGLLGSPKSLPPKLFYDARGAELFERICTLPEYYLTRSELEILGDNLHEIAGLAGQHVTLVEYGSGAGVKVRLLLDALDAPAAWIPVDISREQLDLVSREIAVEFPGVRVTPLCADYTLPLELPRPAPDGRTVAFFPGSTIGNFHPMEAAAFLRRVRRAVGGSGALLLGLDRRKDARILNAAYNDSAGVTAEFNLNMLARLNREMCAGFDLALFEHRAFFNPLASRMEMHLASTAQQEIHVAGHLIGFGNGETIWTESSYKYDLPALTGLASLSGFRVERLWTDSADNFWIAWLEAA